MLKTDVKPAYPERLELQGQAYSESIFHLAMLVNGQRPGTLLDRYGFLKTDWPVVRAKTTKTAARCEVTTGGGALAFTGGTTRKVTLKDAKGKVLLKGVVKDLPGGGFQVEFDLADDEKLYGLGDQIRDQIQRRGLTVPMWVKNVISYIPVPFMMSSRGYGLMLNTTRKHYWDLGKSDKKKLKIISPEGSLDLYLFTGPTFKDILKAYTDLTGKPCLPPKWSFGLWYICNSYVNQFELVQIGRNFRDRGIPCDILGLEPGWMETIYDYGVEKKWNSARFPNKGGSIGAIKQLGFHFELWLCNDYDLTYEEERRIGNDISANASSAPEYCPDDVVHDPRITRPQLMDTITRSTEPWFEHLKQFVKQGVDFFKQDGANQVRIHPDRMWGGIYSDAEIHNIYPLLYSRQMYEGFTECTDGKRRPLVFTPDGWIGLQAYSGTWTGDTGGGARTLTACLNLAMSGHGLVTCDMNVYGLDSIHYGFLSPWAQINSFHYFREPWLINEKLYGPFLDYARLRSRLIPYLYTYAYEAHCTGVPMLRPLVMEYPDDPKTAANNTVYMLGDRLLVTAFGQDAYLPAGQWLDFWTAKRYPGGRKLKYDVPENRGGGLFLRDGSILPLAPVTDHVGQKTDEGFTVTVFLADETSAAFDMFDDDGVSFEYRKGNFAMHAFRAELTGDTLAVTLPKGVKVDLVEAYLPAAPAKVTVNGRAVEATADTADGKYIVTLA